MSINWLKCPNWLRIATFTWNFKVISFRFSSSLVIRCKFSSFIDFSKKETRRQKNLRIWSKKKNVVIVLLWLVYCAFVVRDTDSPVYSWQAGTCCSRFAWGHAVLCSFVWSSPLLSCRVVLFYFAPASRDKSWWWHSIFRRQW